MQIVCLYAALFINIALMQHTTGCIKKNATSEFPKKSTLQFLSIKDFRPLGIEIELLIDHIAVPKRKAWHSFMFRALL